MINSLPNNKILDWPKLKAFADENLDVAKVMIYFYVRAENIVKKKIMLFNSIFSFFHNVFKRLLPQGH